MIFKRCDCPAPTKCQHPYWYEFEYGKCRYRRSTHTAARQAAKRAEQKRHSAVVEGRDAPERSATSLAAHIATYCAHTKDKNATGYKDPLVLGRLLTIVGDVPLPQVSGFQIEKWKSSRLKEVGKSTVNRELNILRACFTRAIEWKLITRSPLADVEDYRIDNSRIRVLTHAEADAIVTSPDRFVALLCYVTLVCLPRISEVLALHATHIGHNWIELRRKGGIVTRNAATPELCAELLSRCHPVSGFVFGVGSQGRVPGQVAASMRVSHALRKLGIVGATHHTMRHTGVTWMLEAGRNPRVIQKLAGWSSLAMLERYGHARDAEMVGAVAGIAGLLPAVPTRVPTVSENPADLTVKAAI
jgi:integrase